MNGKGDKPRPLGVSQEQFDQNWDRIFLKEVPDHDNPPEGGAMWVHHCTVKGPHMIAKGQHCAFCGVNEDGR